MESFLHTEPFIERLFGKHVTLFPSVNELFELELAYLEYNCLSKEDLLKRSAYIMSCNGHYSNHYLLFSRNSKNIHFGRTSATKAYFDEGIYSTGYATHGLFPYRGKFHPQLVKGLINILSLNVGDVVLDPMAGSGTTNVEAALMGIHSKAIDISPFCQFMIKTKYEALTIDTNILNQLDLDHRKIFNFFQKGNALDRIEKVGEFEKIKVYNLAFLAFLDALGYSKRVISSTHQQLFEKVLTRYLETLKMFLSNPYFNKNKLGVVEILSDSGALDIKLPDEAIDCIITSPPYSFAIDYVENDKDQLEFLGYDSARLRQELIGLRGKSKNERLENYFIDMEVFCREASRVLKKSKYFVLIIGSNTNQTNGIRLEEKIITFAKKYDFVLIKSILKQIKGMRNIMTHEYILIFRKY